MWDLREFPTGPTETSGEENPGPSLSGGGAVVLRQGGDLAQRERERRRRRRRKVYSKLMQ